MGHVDHGKTTILDYLRFASIVKKTWETWRYYSAYRSVFCHTKKENITFSIRPGHAAFPKMRRGAIVTDIVILVVAADDSGDAANGRNVKHAQSGVQWLLLSGGCDLV